MRKISALFVTVGMLATLTACVGDPGYTACAHYDSGDASSVVTANGEFGSQPTIDFPTPIVTGTTQATELVAGDGERLDAGQPVRIELSIFNGTTGEEVQSTPYDGNGIVTMAGKSTLPAVGLALECATVGSRLAVAASAQDGHNAQEIPQLQVAADDTFVFVVDVLDAYLPRANGTPQLPQASDPTVVIAPNGAPGITIPESGSSAVEPPKDLVVSTLERGDGAELAEGDHAVLHYTGVLWDTNKVFDSTWTDGTAAVLQLSEQSVVEGFMKGLVGQTVGSQVLLVIPPELAYGDAGNGAVPAGATLVFVVDILGQISQG